MAVTHGHGNPNWTRDEVILALDLYFDLDGSVPGPSDARIQQLSSLLRAFPHHALAARKASFRNPDGVAFKLQNLRQVATGKGLGNVSRVDREIWNEFGASPQRTKGVAELIRVGVDLVQAEMANGETDEEFVEGRIVTDAHLRRERSPRLRKKLIQHRTRNGRLRCDICDTVATGVPAALKEAMFEGHHVLPLAAGGERVTRLRDMALLCANCHRLLHRAIIQQRRWLTLGDAREILRERG